MGFDITKAVPVDSGKRAKETYLGNGLYCSFDGWQIKLRAPHSNGVDHEVFLDPVAQVALYNFMRIIDSK